MFSLGSSVKKDVANSVVLCEVANSVVLQDEELLEK